MNSIPPYAAQSYSQLPVSASEYATQTPLPPSPRFQTQQQYNQDTNYVGITISEDPPPALTYSTHQATEHTESAYHSENSVSRVASSFGVLSPSKRQLAKRISDSSIYQSNVEIPQIGPPTAPTYDKASLARRSSAT